MRSHLADTIGGGGFALVCCRRRAKVDFILVLDAWGGELGVFEEFLAFGTDHAWVNVSLGCVGDDCGLFWRGLLVVAIDNYSLCSYLVRTRFSLKTHCQAYNPRCKSVKGLMSLRLGDFDREEI